MWPPEKRPQVYTIEKAENIRMESLQPPTTTIRHHLIWDSDRSSCSTFSQRRFAVCGIADGHGSDGNLRGLLSA